MTEKRIKKQNVRLTAKNLLEIKKFAEKISAYYELFNWTWSDGNSLSVPTVKDIERMIKRLYKDISRKRDTTYISCGGIVVERDEEFGTFAVKWRLEETLWMN